MRPIYIVIHGIRKSISGLPFAALMRYKELSKTYKDIEFLTLADWNSDINYLKKYISTSGIVENIKIRNIYNYFSKLGETELKSLYRKEASIEGECKDYFREDNTKYLSVFNNGNILLFNRKGGVIRKWGYMSAFCENWIDLLSKNTQAILIKDTSGYKLHNRHIVLQLIHENHGTELELNNSSRNIIMDSRQFDRLVVLTEEQNIDLKNVTSNTTVIPNIYPHEPLKEIKDRNPLSFVIINRLVPMKRIDHSIRAINRVANATLDIYGNGADELRLKKLVDELKLNDRVKFKGYNVNARDRYKEYSFSLLTSESECFPYSLIESIFGGCIPISYDIKYGPKTMIDHGVNGFIVPQDSNSLSKIMRSAVKLDRVVLKEMRVKCIETAKKFLPENVGGMWIKLIEEVNALGKRIRINREIKNVSINVNRIELNIDDVESVSLCFTFKGEYIRRRCDFGDRKFICNIPKIDKKGEYDIFVEAFKGNSYMRCKLKSVCDVAGFKRNKGYLSLIV